MGHSVADLGPVDHAFYIIVMAREFDEQIESTNPDSGSNLADDSEIDALEEEEADDPVQQEARRRSKHSMSTSSSISSR